MISRTMYSNELQEFITHTKKKKNKKKNKKEKDFNRST